jgi:hypothetical protein
MQTWDPSRSNVLHTSRELSDAWEQRVHDEALAARWGALRDLPDGTLGRDVARFYDARGFAFPGAPGSAPPLLAQHDWVHVLTGYGSTVEAEIEVFAFIARSNDDPRGFSLLAQVVSLFETGYAASGMGLFEYDRGHLSHEGMAVRLADALRRGALCGAANQGVDLLGVDWFEHAALPVDEVRERLGIPPKDARAVDLGSVTPWEAGGISAYQYAAGRKAAEAAGRAYRRPEASAERVPRKRTASRPGDDSLQDDDAEEDHEEREVEHPGTRDHPSDRSQHRLREAEEHAVHGRGDATGAQREPRQDGPPDEDQEVDLQQEHDQPAHHGLRSSRKHNTWVHTHTTQQRRRPDRRSRRRRVAPVPRLPAGRQRA